MKIFAGNSNRHLAEAICNYLNVPLGKASVRRFADQEIFVEIQENVRGEDVFVVQPTSFPTNDHLMELLIMIDAMRRSSARRITAVIPYFGYARQDRRAVRAHADLGQAGGQSDHRGRRRPRSDARPARRPDPGLLRYPDRQSLCGADATRDIKANYDISNVMVVSPDVGGVVRARALAKRLDCLLAIVDKRRDRPGESEVMNIIGEVTGKDCILIDDIVNSGGTLCNAADALLAQGATSVTAYITHGVLSGGAVTRVTNSKLKELVITDSIQPTTAVQSAPNIRVISTASLIGEAINRTSQEESVSSLFD